jgi:hypothetical protein
VLLSVCRALFFIVFALLLTFEAKCTPTDSKPPEKYMFTITIERKDVKGKKSSEVFLAGWIGI